MNLTKFAAIWVKKDRNAQVFVAPEKLENHSSKAGTEKRILKIRLDTKTWESDNHFCFTNRKAGTLP